jgi:hypothetical protein
MGALLRAQDLVTSSTESSGTESSGTETSGKDASRTACGLTTGHKQPKLQNGQNYKTGKTTKTGKNSR